MFRNFYFVLLIGIFRDMLGRGALVKGGFDIRGEARFCFFIYIYVFRVEVILFYCLNCLGLIRFNRE